VLVLSNSLGADLSMWKAQVEPFARRFRVLRYDTRGHGASAATAGPYNFDQLGGDVLALLDSLSVEHASFCGLSMGGATGMWLALHAPERFTKVVLCNTAARFGTPDLWNARIETARKDGLAALADTAMERWFSAAFRASAAQVVHTTRAAFVTTNAAGYIACCEAIRDVDLRESIAGIRLPTLVIAGAQDPATPPEAGRFIAERIPGARYVELDAAHLSNIERAEEFTDTVLKFLTT
jgi:3-oxoadipate enol-lactonase